MKKNTLKSAGVIVSGLLIAAATAGTFALWNDQSTVSGGEVFSGNLDLNVTNTSWEDVSLKDGSKGSLDSEGKVYAWGSNSSGRLGNNSTTNSSVPVQVNFE